MTTTLDLALSTPNDDSTKGIWGAGVNLAFSQVQAAVNSLISDVDENIGDLTGLSSSVSDALAAAAAATTAGAAASATGAAAQTTADAAAATADTALSTGTAAAAAASTAQTAADAASVAAAAAQAEADAINAGGIISTMITDGAISTPKLAANAVTAAKIAAATITASQIAANTITAAQIAAATITTSLLAANAVQAGQIAANAVTSATIAAGAVTTGALAANAVTAGKIAANTITAAQIAASTITASQLAAGSVQATQIAAGAVVASKIDAAAINGMTITGATLIGASIETAPGLTIGGTTKGIALTATIVDSIQFYTGSSQEFEYGFANVGTHLSGAFQTGTLALGSPTMGFGTQASVIDLVSQSHDGVSTPPIVSLLANGGDVQFNGVSLPRGVVGSFKSTSSDLSPSATTAETILYRDAITCTVVAGRLYRVMALWNAAPSVVNASATASLFVRSGTGTDGTEVAVGNMPQATTANMSLLAFGTFVGGTDVSAGINDFTLTARAAAGTLTPAGTTANGCRFTIEDIGTA